MESKSSTTAQRFPEIAHQTWEDPRSRTRTKRLEVLMLGMMRTGTMSMITAYKELGYTGFYHMTAVMRNPPDAQMWTEYLHRKLNGEKKPFTRKDWDQLLGNAQVVCDVPSVCALPDLIEAYPEAKVVLTERDPDSWYESFYESVQPVCSGKTGLILGAFDTSFLQPWFTMVEAMFAVLWGPKGWEEPAPVIKRRYHELHEEIRRLVPPERLLDYKLEMGWEPLCEFLSKEVPKRSFPHVNERKVFSQRINYMFRLTAKRLAWEAFPYLTVAATAGAMGWAWFRGTKQLWGTAIRSSLGSYW